MRTVLFYVAAAVLEIAGCFAFWSWLRLGRSPWMIVAGVVSLGLFAVSLTRVDIGYAGRAYAAYGGVYIVTSLLWLWAVEGVRPDVRDMAGALLCLAGVAVMVIARR